MGIGALAAPSDQPTDQIGRGWGDARTFSARYGALSDTVKEEFHSFLARMRHENETQRKPCTICGTLVKPDHLSRHNAAYHDIPENDE